MNEMNHMNEMNVFVVQCEQDRYFVHEKQDHSEKITF